MIRRSPTSRTAKGAGPLLVALGTLGVLCILGSGAADAQRQPPKPDAQQMEGLKRILRSILGDSARSGAETPNPNNPQSRPPGRSMTPPPADMRRHSMEIDIAAVRADTVFAPFREQLRAGRLDQARAALRTVAQSGRSPVEREVAEYDLVEVDFFDAHFDTAAAGYREFARRHPRGYLTNDAITRVFLIDENSDSGQRPLIMFATAARELRAGRIDSASALLKQAAERYPGSALEDDILIALGDAALLVPNPTAALGYYQAVVDSMPESPLAPSAMMRIGHIRAEMSQDFAAAIATYERVLEKYPNSIEADEARKLIERLKRRT